MVDRVPRVAVVEGARPVIEALRAGRRAVHEIRIPPGEGSAALRALREAAERTGVPVFEGTAGAGVTALADPYPELTFEELLSRGGPRRFVALDGVTDVGNLGSIARTAEASGITGLVLEERRAPPIHAGALRASAGALEHLCVARAPNLARALDLARSEGLIVLAADPRGTALPAADPELLCRESVLLLGSEDRGIRTGLLRRADLRIGIPMEGQVESLGVAAAAAYLLLRLAELRAEREEDRAPGPDLPGPGIIGRLAR
jgi:23S rRNA (guanosine2251-2'-O)-methyltransferase